MQGSPADEAAEEGVAVVEGFPVVEEADGIRDRRESSTCPMQTC